MVKLLGKAISKVKSVGAKVLDVVSTAYAHPIKTVVAAVSPSKTIKEEVIKFRSQPVEEQQRGIIKAAAGYSATLLTAGAISIKGAASAAGAVITRLIPSTTKGKVIAVVAAPIAVGAVIREPAKAAKTIIKAPSELAQFGGDVASFAANPSLETAKDIITESPLISSGVAAGAAIALGKGLIPAIATYRQTEAIQEQTEAIQQATSNISTGQGQVLTTNGKTGEKTAAFTPLTPATQEVKAITTKGYKRRKTLTKPNNINQKVNILIANRGNTSTKNYIKREALLN